MAKFTLPSLAFDYGALEPHIDAMTMNIHHTKHHNTYVNNMNGVVEKSADLAAMDLLTLCKSVGTAAIPSECIFIGA